MRQLTLRGFDKDLARRIRNLARSEGLSLNQAALRLLRRGAGLEETREATDLVGSALDHLIGTWSDEEAQEFERSVQDLEQVDPSLWE